MGKKDTSGTYSTDGKGSAATERAMADIRKAQDRRYRADMDLRQNPPRR
ncbi:hypothetical protein GAR05_06167 [Micromonospora saelicesensis]|uniref:Uncharacterized protein n=1 Tax=Micromonospora saelicesensis TaxID=285676 RepID=A0ABX9CAF9_9ACTN|nr:hypothetical protein [Micromonospora saelicesensis]RAN92675.1 hypothetical protein GAR05_06167 [Micromonospora saelicesensis]